MEDLVVTEQGLEELKKKLENLKTVKRQEVIDKINLAREFGDFSENAEYDAAKEEQARVEKEINDLEYKINNASTETNYNFKAFLYYPEKNILGVPVEKDTDSGIKQKYILFKVEDGKLSLVNEYLHDYFKYDYY